MTPQPDKGGVAVKTNGVGKVTTAHLNLTKSLALGFAKKPRAKPVHLDGDRLTLAQRIVATMYPTEAPTNEIARTAKISPGSVKVIASRLGLRRPPKKRPEPVRVRRPPYAGYDRYERPWG